MKKKKKRKRKSEKDTAVAYVAKGSKQRHRCRVIYDLDNLQKELGTGDDLQKKVLTYYISFFFFFFY